MPVGRWALGFICRDGGQRSYPLHEGCALREAMWLARLVDMRVAAPTQKKDCATQDHEEPEHLCLDNSGCRYIGAGLFGYVDTDQVDSGVEPPRRSGEAAPDRKHSAGDYLIEVKVRPGIYPLAFMMPNRLHAGDDHARGIVLSKPIALHGPTCHSCRGRVGIVPVLR
jgi:hypothetical protein